MTEARQHTLTLTDRNHLVADGVRHVGTFTDQEIHAETALGNLVIRGEELHIVELNLDSGRLVIEGLITSLNYPENQKPSARGFWARLTR